ncbi:hypothetical protein [Brevundimonas sp.]|uniref:hypothetical protein n=1 Tax=Brevundimonas sp. TaxID=1871086 RepID=UPI003BA8B264
MAAPHANAMIISVPVVAKPELANEPTGESVLTTQWFDGQGGGAVEQAAALLEEAGLTGWFFIDVEQGSVLGEDRTAGLVRRLVDGGHRIGIHIGAGNILQPDVSIPARLETIMTSWARLAGQDSGPLGVMLGAGPTRAAWGEALAAAGVAGIVISRAAQSDLASWASWRTSPFAPRANLVAFPVTTFLSTPAHSRDRVVRHTLSNSDALAAGSAEQTLAADLQLSGSQRLAIMEIDALRLLHVRTVKDRLQARSWNLTVRRALPSWYRANWKRSLRKFYVAEGLSAIQKQLLARMLSALADAGPQLASWNSLFDRDSVTGWLAPDPVFEGVLEHRRGPRRLRVSSIRRYDNTYRRALGAKS